MITLALDTTGAWCSCALINSNRVLLDASEKIGRGHAERLAPMVAETLERTKTHPSNVDRIVACTGPGSFTGLRVALAFARSFALPFNTPVIGISALQALATEADPEQQQNIVAAINAKRGDICWAYYAKGVEISPPVTQSVEIASAKIKALKPDFVVGDGSGLIGFSDSEIDHVNAPILGWLGEHLTPDNYPPEPFYARGPDAKLPGGKTLA